VRVYKLYLLSLQNWLHVFIISYSAATVITDNALYSLLLNLHKIGMCSCTHSYSGANVNTVWLSISWVLVIGLACS